MQRRAIPAAGLEAGSCVKQRLHASHLAQPSGAVQQRALHALDVGVAAGAQPLAQAKHVACEKRCRRVGGRGGIVPPLEPAPPSQLSWLVSSWAHSKATVAVLTSSHQVPGALLPGDRLLQGSQLGGREGGRRRAGRTGAGRRQERGSLQARAARPCTDTWCGGGQSRPNMAGSTRGQVRHESSGQHFKTCLLP